MYSRDEKTKIIEALIESGMTATQASRQPGWPGRAALKKWLKEAEEGSLPVRVSIPKGHTGERVKHKRYSMETKTEAIRLYGLGVRPVDIARRLDIDCSPNVRVWWKKAKIGKLNADPFKPKPFSGESKVLANMPKKKVVSEEVAALSASELENACLRAVLADLKAGGWDPDSISNRKKVELGERLRLEPGRALQEIIDFLKISKSSYEYHKVRLSLPDKYAEVRAQIRTIFFENNKRYGYRPIWQILRDTGIRISEKVVRRIMKEEGLIVRYEPKIKRYSSYAGETSWAPPNLVKRDFKTGLPNFLWLTDLTEFSLDGFKCYLSPVIDCFDGKVVSWRLSKIPNAELVNTMLDEAISTLKLGEAPMIHTDRGAHYRWPGWIDRCNENGLTRSMSAKGCSPDNSACEGFFGRLKNEFFYHRNWAGYTFEQFKSELDEYIRWYNDLRIKKSLGWMSPTEYRLSLGLAA
jgi:Transposase and inactivated derivatives